MKNLTSIILIAIALNIFMACSSEGNTKKSESTAPPSSNVAAPAQATNENAISETTTAMESTDKADVIASSESTSTNTTSNIASKVNEAADKVNAETSKAKDKLAAAAEEKKKAFEAAKRNVEQKQKPSVQDVEVNNPTRPEAPKPKEVKLDNTPPVSTPVIEKNPVTKTTDKIKEEVDNKAKEIRANEIHKHSEWNALLGKHVSSSGKVNYKGFKSDLSKLNNYLKLLAENPVKSSWSRGEKMAYWINAYNAFTVKLIVDNYPIKSITKLDNGKPWDKKWIKLGTKTYSLNNIENDILRPTYKDARIHFAVNCAAKSCPPLLNKAWTASNLESNFERQAKAFINNKTFNRVEKKEVVVSKIFEWYAVDFDDLITYLNKYATTKADSKAKVKFMDYNWDLNE